MKILIVDDNADDSVLLRRGIKRYGHEVIEAVDGRDGLEKAASNMPDIIAQQAVDARACSGWMS